MLSIQCFCIRVKRIMCAQVSSKFYATTVNHPTARIIGEYTKRIITLLH